jgi:alpha-glucosidase
MGLGMGLSGAPNIGHDIGGFHGPRPDPELFVRWVQNGIFHPRFTIHSWNNDNTTNEPWMYPQVLSHIRETINFRYRLRPYLYSLFWESHQTGHPIIRPTVYHYADDPNTHNQSFEFMLGESLLVATVLEQGARTRDVYLPAGTGWTDFHTGVRYNGGQTVTVEAPLSRYPLFVPDNGIIPLGTSKRNTTDEPHSTLDIHIFPHPTDGVGTVTLYEDDGVSPTQSTTPHTIVMMTLQTTDKRLTITIEEQSPDYQLPYAEVRVLLPPGEGRLVSVPGRDWSEYGTLDRRLISIPL